MTQSCMGGGCAIRIGCAHYEAASVLQAPAERLCVRGRDGVARAKIEPISAASAASEADKAECGCMMHERCVKCGRYQ